MIYGIVVAAEFSITVGTCVGEIVGIGVSVDVGVIVGVGVGVASSLSFNGPIISSCN
jgi:hypothetical protein